MKRYNEHASQQVAVGCFLFWVSVAAFAGSHAASPLKADAVLNDIKARGARAVVETFWTSNDQWSVLMTNIGRGERKWLDVAVALHPGTDGGAAETLDEAIFFALKPAPIAVLQLLKDKQFDADFVCSSNIGTDYSPSKSRRFVKDRIQVLESLSDPSVEGVRDQCLTDLRAALKDLAASKK